MVPAHPDQPPNGQAPLDDLRQAAAGDPEALHRVMPLVYERVREVAGQLLYGDRAGRWVRASSLVNRAVVRLLDQRNVDFADEARVTAVLATIMRRLVVDIARRETALKRGGGAVHVSLNTGRLAGDHGDLDALEIEDALVALAVVSPDAARIAELRLWGGMELEQIAVALDVPFGRVRRRWNLAKAWLARELGLSDGALGDDEGPCAGAGKGRA